MRLSLYVSLSAVALAALAWTRLLARPLRLHRSIDRDRPVGSDLMRLTGNARAMLTAERSALNTECKLMLLRHAFEQQQCIAVEFRTHRLNTASRRAIERLGAQLDGILRAHQRTADGNLRDTAVYSITAAEWPTVRTHLMWQLQKPR